MVSTKLTANTIPEIDVKLKSFGSDMVKIEFLENCLKNMLANDVKRYCHLKLADLYAYRLMWQLAAKNMDAAADCATTYKDKINFYMKEITFLIKTGDYLFIDKAFKKAMMCGTDKEKEAIKAKLKTDMYNQAAEYEKRNNRSNAAKIYERLLEMSITTDTEKKQLMAKLGDMYSKLGKIKEAMRFESMSTKPIEKPRDFEHVKKISFEDLGIDEVY